MKISSATPVLFVDRVEPTRDFFLRAGFEVMFDVPEGDHLGFVGLHQGEAQVMVETRGIAALKGAKVVGFAKSGLAQSIYAELKQHRINKPLA